MSDKPTVGSYIHGQTYPNKLAIYNLDFYHGKRATHMPEPWAVDHGNNGLETFPTFEQALDYVRDEIAKASPMEVS
jgi:hypothetical protein